MFTFCSETGSHVAQAGLKLYSQGGNMEPLVLLLQTRKWWTYRYAIPWADPNLGFPTASYRRPGALAARGCVGSLPSSFQGENMRIGSDTGGGQ